LIDYMNTVNAIAIFAGALTLGTMFTLPFPTVPWAENLPTIANFLAISFALFTSGLALTLLGRVMSAGWSEGTTPAATVIFTMGIGCIQVGFILLSVALRFANMKVAAILGISILSACTTTSWFLAICQAGMAWMGDKPVKPLMEKAAEEIAESFLEAGDITELIGSLPTPTIPERARSTSTITLTQ
jgi:hypothetical protein